MLVYMTHPIHGVHIVYDENHLQTALAQGWTVREEKKEAAPVVPPPVVEAPVVEPPAAEPEKPKRGRPPKK